MAFQGKHAKVGVHLIFPRLLPHNGYTVQGILFSMHQCSQNQNASFALLCRNPYMGFQRTHALRLGVHITFLRLLPHNGYTVPGVLLSLHECSQENLAGEPKRLICTMQDPPHGVSKGARFTAEAPSAPWLIHPLFYGGAYVISNQDPR